MTEQRQAMDAALRAAFADHLRPSGFTGSLPHLRRRGPTQIDLLTVQYFSSGGSFVVEVAACPAEGITTSWGKHIPPAKVNVQWTMSARIGSPTFPVGDYWFTFGERMHETAVRRPDSHYAAVADQVMHFVRTQAEPYWAGWPATERPPPVMPAESN